MSEHISNEDLIQRLYGLGSDSGHLAGCAECSARFQALEARKSGVTVAEEIPGDFLAAQRRAVYTRVGERPSSFHAWIPALATAALLAVGIFVYQPASHREVKVVSAPAMEVGDAQLFSEAVSIEQTAEPLAVAPMHGLFQGSEQ